MIILIYLYESLLFFHILYQLKTFSPKFFFFNFASRESLSREIFSISLLAKVYLANFSKFLHSRKFIHKISRFFLLAKLSLAKVSPIKVSFSHFNQYCTSTCKLSCGQTNFLSVELERGVFLLSL